MKILIISHGHPDFSKGGGELAAYALFQRYREMGLDAHFLAAHKISSLHHGGTPFSMLREREILFYSQMQDYFLVNAATRRTIWKDFAELLEILQPDVIHFHHYIHIGIQFVREAAKYRARHPERRAKIVCTLHEYYAICANQGQMIMKNSNSLCTEASPQRCSACLGERTPEDHFLREKFMKACLGLVDDFVSPSHFLKDAYEDWGLARPITVIENGQKPVGKLAPRSIRSDEIRGRFAYLGQINRFKGLDLLLAAMSSLPPELEGAVELHVYGSGLENQEEGFRITVETAFRNLQSTVFHGPYDQRQLAGILADVDTVIVPSIWWENSPLVIQEALKYGRPVICADIGGMREKVSDGVNGMHFTRGSASSLINAIATAVKPATWQAWHEASNLTASIDVTAAANLRIYNTDTYILS